MNDLPIYREAALETLSPGLYFALFHGRCDPDVVLDDWGENGPMLGPLRYVHTTYGSEIKFEFESAADRARAFPHESPVAGYRCSPSWRDIPGCKAPSLDALRVNPALAYHPAVESIIYQTHGWLSVSNGLVKYADRFYGDWTVFQLSANRRAPRSHAPNS